MDIRTDFILLRIFNTNFLLSSDTPISSEVKDDIEIVCRCAFEEDSPLLAVSDAIGYQELVEMDCYDVALLIKNYAEQKYGVRLQFAPLTLEIVVDK